MTEIFLDAVSFKKKHETLKFLKNKFELVQEQQKGETKYNIPLTQSTGYRIRT